VFGTADLRHRIQHPIDTFGVTNYFAALCDGRSGSATERICSMKSIASSTFSTRVCASVFAASALVAVAAACGSSGDVTSTQSTTTIIEAATETSTTATPTPVAESPGTQPVTDQFCEVGGNSVMIDSAIAQIAPPMPGVGWVPGESNISSCATLTYVTLDTEGATVSSPYQLLFFHEGEFLGTGTSCNLSYQTVTGASDDQIDVRYRYLVGDEPNADPQGETSVSYRWNGSGVDMIGELPEAVTRGEC
jgi:hypothetical protein